MHTRKHQRRFLRRRQRVALHLHQRQGGGALGPLQGGTARQERLGGVPRGGGPRVLPADQAGHGERGVTTELETESPVLGTWVAGRAYPSREGLSVYFRDITERKRAEEAQRFLVQASSVFSSSSIITRPSPAWPVSRCPRWPTGAVDILEEDGQLKRLAVEHPDPGESPAGLRARAAIPAGPRRPERGLPRA